MPLYDPPDSLTGIVAEHERRLRRMGVGLATTAEHDHTDFLREPQGATLPSLVGKVAGRDGFFLDTGVPSTSKLYRITGAAGVTLDDTFDRDDTSSGTLGTSTPSGHVWSGSGPIIQSGAAVKSGSGWATYNLGSGPHEAVLEFVLPTVGSGTTGTLAEVAVVTSSAFALHDGGRGYIDLDLNNGAYRLSRKMAFGNSNVSPSASLIVVSGDRVRMELIVNAAKTQLYMRLTNLRSGDIAEEWQSAGAQAGTWIGFRFPGSNAIPANIQLDSVTFQQTGTLAWESTDEYVAPHVHDYVPLAQPIATKTANYTLTTSDAVILSNNTTLTMTLPSAVAVGAGRSFTVKNLHATLCTVASTAGTIDGAATQSLLQYESITVVSDATNWHVV